MEVIFPDDGGEVILGHPLPGSCHSLELCEPRWVVHALLEEVKLRLAHSHLAVESEQAFSGVIEGLEADRFEGQVF